MSGEIIEIARGVGIIGTKGMVSLFNILSAFGGAIVGGILTFLGSLWIFNQQKKSDARKIKIEKSLELLSNIDRIITLFVSDLSTGYFHFNLSKSGFYNRNLFDSIYDISGKSNILYYYIFNKKSDVWDNVYGIACTLELHLDGIDDADLKELEENGKTVKNSLDKIKEELDNFIK